MAFNSNQTKTLLNRVAFDSNGLVPAIVQEAGSGEVLMLAWMSRATLEETIATQRATYWSRSRGERWVKGETSGHSQFVHTLSLDCDGDTLLLTVDQVGAACHTGSRSCFDTERIVAIASSDIGDNESISSARSTNTTNEGVAGD